MLSWKVSLLINNSWTRALKFTVNFGRFRRDSMQMGKEKRTPRGQGTKQVGDLNDTIRDVRQYPTQPPWYIILSRSDRLVNGRSRAAYSRRPRHWNARLNLHSPFTVWIVVRHFFLWNTYQLLVELWRERQDHPGIFRDPLTWRDTMLQVDSWLGFLGHIEVYL